MSGRKPKNNVDYFPHPVTNGSRMFTMEQIYNDKGYVAYYKLLEMIGRSPGHFIDFNLEKNILYFSAQIRADKELTLQIINTLSEVEAIDQVLWSEKKIVWCQEFVDKIAHLYDKRRQSVPQKPGEMNSRPENDSSTVVSAPEISQSKVKDSKVKEISLKERERVNEPLIEIFFKDLPTSSEFETICRNQKLTKEYLLDMIPKFRTDGAEPTYPNFQRFAAHFGNWIRKNRTEVKQSDQPGVYKGSFFNGQKK